jgi:anti-sigma factor RsiW
MKPRDVELLSAYLDGQLSPSNSARLESRLRSDPELVAVMNDLRTARGYLRQLPKRRAPRNFTLTRKMVGLNPPLPRSYPAFRFTTAIATLLFFLTYGVNVLVPQFRPAGGIGSGGGNDMQVFAMEAPALESQPAMATEAPAATEPPAPMAAAPAPTMQAEATSVPDAARVIETPAAKAGGDMGENSVTNQDQPQVSSEPQALPPIIPVLWQYILLGVAALGAILMTVLRRSSARRWK